MSLLTKAIIAALFGAFIVTIISALPDASVHPVPPEIATGFLTMYQYIAPIDYLIPLRLILNLFALSILMEFFIGFWRLIMWIISIIKYFLA